MPRHDACLCVLFFCLRSVFRRKANTFEHIHGGKAASSYPIGSDISQQQRCTTVQNTPYHVKRNLISPHSVTDTSFRRIL